MATHGANDDIHALKRGLQCRFVLVFEDYGFDLSGCSGGNSFLDDIGLVGCDDL